MAYLENLYSLQGKVALVTGATRGLGQGISEALLRAGATVVLNGSNHERLAETTQQFADEGLPVVEFPCDLADATQVAELAEFVLREQPRIDVLVNNAGVTFPHELLDYPDDAWHQTIRVNLEAPFQLSRRLAPRMKEQGGGSIINITSIAAELGFPNNPAYGAAKGALKQLTKSMAFDLGPFGVRVNNLGPGYFHTDMANLSYSDPERREARADRTLLGRWGEPEDLAGAVIFLASDASRYMTGQDLYIDGGWLAKGL
ncbi:MAG: glucose 1-dehydrogenase [Planctomycetes bacterium]|nr:glucose 1-dehydrogenase [Planctomycetota bacterium]MBL7038954.1 glucose 1-dehydrogenase [Pirellulaceae bacterium]